MTETVERFLDEEVGLFLWYWHGSPSDRRGPGRHWALTMRCGDTSRSWDVDWPHDREPTLQEAIEARVVAQGEGA